MAVDSFLSYGISSLISLTVLVWNHKIALLKLVVSNLVLFFFFFLEEKMELDMFHFSYCYLYPDFHLIFMISNSLGIFSGFLW